MFAFSEDVLFSNLLHRLEFKRAAETLQRCMKDPSELGEGQPSLLSVILSPDLYLSAHQHRLALQAHLSGASEGSDDLTAPSDVLT